MLKKIRVSLNTDKEALLHTLLYIVEQLLSGCQFFLFDQVFRCDFIVLIITVCVILLHHQRYCISQCIPFHSELVLVIHR